VGDRGSAILHAWFILFGACLLLGPAQPRTAHRPPGEAGTPRPGERVQLATLHHACAPVILAQGLAGAMREESRRRRRISAESRGGVSPKGSGSTGALRAPTLTFRRWGLEASPILPARACISRCRANHKKRHDAMQTFSLAPSLRGGSLRKIPPHRQNTAGRNTPPPR
jgi:hypothetical protein